MAETYFLGLSSHKGGTGRSTAVAALSWALGQRGISCGILDADPVGATTLLVTDDSGQCPFSNVRLLTADDKTIRYEDFPIVLVDCPALTDYQSEGFLEQLDGIILMSHADPLAIRTTPSAVRAIQRSRQQNRDLKFLGLLISHFAEDDRTQRKVMEDLIQQQSSLLWRPAIPHDPALSAWAEVSGTEPPDGPGRNAYLTLAEHLAKRLSLGRTPLKDSKNFLRSLLGI